MKLNTNFWLESAAAAERQRIRRARRVTLALAIGLVSECIVVAVAMLWRK